VLAHPAQLFLVRHGVSEVPGRVAGQVARRATGYTPRARVRRR
jgi:hypothetical protein